MEMMDLCLSKIRLRPENQNPDANIAQPFEECGCDADIRTRLPRTMPLFHKKPTIMRKITR